MATHKRKKRLAKNIWFRSVMWLYTPLYVTTILVGAYTIHTTPNITLWEIATLYSLDRIDLRLPLRDWLERATAPPLVRRFGISPAVASEVAALPDSFHRDPADRIIVATARILGATLLTQDQRIRRAKLVDTL